MTTMERKATRCTELGRFLRHIRLDTDEVLGDMAVNLDISPAYLSAIENGKRELPEGFCDSVIQKYRLDAKKAYELKKLEMEMKRQLIIPMNTPTLSPQQVDTALMFARDFSKLNESQLDKIIMVIKGEH